MQTNKLLPLRLFGAFTFLLVSVVASPASAALRTYRATWSGAAEGNTAQAVATIVIDDGLLLNPGLNLGTPGDFVTSFDIHVFGASAGNGTWTKLNFSTFGLNIANALNLFTNWVGQPQPSDTSPWGVSPGIGSFSVLSNTAGAPSTASIHDLQTNSGGSGDVIRLTSFAPVSAEGARVAVGETVNLDLTTLIQAPPGLGLGQTVRVLGLPAGLKFEPATTGDPGPPVVLPTPNRITGTVLGLVGSAGVTIQIRQGSKVLRTIPYNLVVDLYPFAGGFELLLADPEQIAGTTTHASTGGLTIPFVGNATPYPSVINVSSSALGVPTALRVRIQGFSHAWPDDLDVFLMAPDGRVVVLFSDAGASAEAVNVDLTFSDTAAAPLQDSSPIFAGTYLPANYDGFWNDTLPPGMVGDPGSNLKSLLPAGISGDWKLFVTDDTGGQGGSIASWALEFDFAEPAGKLKVTVASPSIRNPDPAFSATLERLGDPRRVGRGSFVLGSSPQTVTVDLPSRGGLDAATYDILLTAGSDLVSGVQMGAEVNLSAMGFRLVRPGRIPGGNPRLTLSLPPEVVGDRFNTPGGTGHATGTVNARALIPLNGQLGDGQPFSTSLNLSQTNQAVVWLTPHKNKGSSLGGIITLGDLGIPGRGASMESRFPFLRWQRVADASALSYPSGFEPMNLGGIVSRWYAVNQAEALAQTLALDGRSLFASYIAPPDGVLPLEWMLRDNFFLVSPFQAPRFASKANGGIGSFSGSRILTTTPAVKASMSGVLLQDETLGSLIGHGLIKIPVSGPGIAKGSFQTGGVVLEH